MKLTPKGIFVVPVDDIIKLLGYKDVDLTNYVDNISLTFHVEQKIIDIGMVRPK